MDARVAESAVTSSNGSWLQRERESGRLYDRAAWLIGAFLLAILALSASILSVSAWNSHQRADRFLTYHRPPCQMWPASTCGRTQAGHEHCVLWSL